MALVTAIRDGRAEWIEAGSNKAVKIAKALWESHEYEMVEARASSSVIFFRTRL